MMSFQKRAIAKQAAFAAAYGMGTNAAFHDEMVHTGLMAHRRPWAKAFREVLGVGVKFYVDADAARKDWLEAHYRELATHDTPKGRKAAKVMARHAVHTAIAYLGPEVNSAMAFDMEADSMGFNFKTAPVRGQVDMVNQQMTMYRKFFGVPKP